MDPAPPGPTLPPAALAAAAAAAADEHPHEGGYRDTIESILIAFILAFIFRAFVVEAFVIPTGSMAPTLLGAHARFTCDDCGYQFEVNYSSRGGGDGPEHPVRGRATASSRTRSRAADARDRPHRLPQLRLHRPRPRRHRDRDDRPDPLRRPHPRAEVRVPAPRARSAGTSSCSRAPTSRLARQPRVVHDQLHQAPRRPAGETLMILDGDVYVSDTARRQRRRRATSRSRASRGTCRTRCGGSSTTTTSPAALQRGSRGDRGERSAAPAGTSARRPAAPRLHVRRRRAAAAGTLRFDTTSTARPRVHRLLAYAQAESGRNNVSDVKLSLLYHRKAATARCGCSLTKLRRHVHRRADARRGQALPQARQAAGSRRPRRGDRVRDGARRSRRASRRCRSSS